MYLYQNILYFIENKIISGYRLSKESGIAQSKIVEMKTKNRELKGTQIDLIFQVLKKMNIVNDINELFYFDLSNNNENTNSEGKTNEKS